MPIPQKFQVDFTPYRRDLIQQAVERLLSQHHCACALKQLVLAFTGEAQCLYDALIDLQEQRTLYKAEGETLSAIGRIVGAERAAYQYDETRWMFADKEAQGPDAASAWCRYSPFGVFVPSDASTYKLNVLSRIVKNHALCASVPELQSLIHMITDEYVSFEKTGPMEITILVPGGLSPEAWYLLTQAYSDRRVDTRFLLPYPATLWFYTLVVFFPERPENLNWFCADRTNMQRCDRAPCAVGVRLTAPDDGSKYVDPDQGGVVTVYLPENWLCADRTNEQRPDFAQCAVGVPYRIGG